MTSLDQYSYDVGFKENGSSSFGTIFGGLISIVIFVCVTIYAVKKGLDFKDRNDSTYSSHYAKHALADGTFRFNDTAFLPAIRLANEQDLPLSQKYFRLSATINHHFDNSFVIKR